MRYLVAIIVLFSLSNKNIYGQRVQLDSLWNVWNDIKHEDTNRLKAISSIIWKEYIYSDPDSAFYFANKMLDLASAKDKPRFEAEAHNVMGVYYYSTGSYLRAIESYEKSIVFYVEAEYENGRASAYGNMGNVYVNQGNYPKAIDCYLQSLEISQALGSKSVMSRMYNNLGVVYEEEGDNEKALKYYKKSLSIKRSLGSKKGLIYSLNNIGVVYGNLGEYDKAINECFVEGIELCKEINDLSGLGYTLANLANIYVLLEDYAKAIKYHNEALEYSELVKDRVGVASSLNVLSEIYYIQGEHDLSLELGIRAYGILKEVGSVKELSDVGVNLYRAYKTAGQADKALGMYELHIEMRDSLEKEETQKKLWKHEYKTKMTEADALVDKKELQTRYSLIIIVILIIIGLVFYKSYMTKEKMNKELKRLSIVASETENIIMILDAEGNLEWVNESFEKLNNLTMSQMIVERGPNIKTISNHSDMTAIFEKCKETKATCRYDSLNHTNQGKMVWESSTITPLYDDSGKLHKFIIIDADVTQLKETEQLLDQKNKDMVSNISYAKKIQEALLPSDDFITKTLPQSFVFYKPKDLVSGDFYWLHKDDDNNIYVAVADCTGHGVSGAFMSIIGRSLLNDIVIDQRVAELDKVLYVMRDDIIDALDQKGEVGEARDGMDISICKMTGRSLDFAGANNSLVLIREGELIELKADPQPIGYYTGEKVLFTNHNLALKKGDMIYLFSDGFQDQFGGPKAKKYMAGKFKKLLLRLSALSCSDQHQALEDELKNWQGKLEQVDDICIMGVRV